MKIHEYQAKGVLRRFGVPLLPGRSATTPDEAVAAAKEVGGGLWVVKSQIHAGGRGKGRFIGDVDDAAIALAAKGKDAPGKGGVRLARSLDDVLRARAPGGVPHRVESASALLNMALLDDHESVAVMPEVVALRLQRLGALVVLPQLLPDVFDPIVAIRLVHGRHAPALQRFLACVREVAADGDLSLSSP